MKKINNKPQNFFWSKVKNIKIPVFLVVLVLTSGVYWNIFNIKLIFTEWFKLPIYVSSNIKGLMSPDAISKIEETRWNAFGDGREDLLSKIFYNKAYMALDRFFDFISFLSPRFYFQAGDGTKFSPPGVEPIVGILFPFFVFGIVRLVKEKNLKVLFSCLIFAGIAFLAGQKNLAYLLPILVTYVYISSKVLKPKFSLLVIVYSLFIVGRILWLTS